MVQDIWYMGFGRPFPLRIGTAEGRWLFCVAQSFVSENLGERLAHPSHLLTACTQCT